MSVRPTRPCHVVSCQLASQSRQTLSFPFPLTPYGVPFDVEPNPPWACCVSMWPGLAWRASFALISCLTVYLMKKREARSRHSFMHSINLDSIKNQSTIQSLESTSIPPFPPCLAVSYGALRCPALAPCPSPSDPDPVFGGFACLSTPPLILIHPQFTQFSTAQQVQPNQAQPTTPQGPFLTVHLSVRPPLIRLALLSPIVASPGLRARKID